MALVKPTVIATPHPSAPTIIEQVNPSQPRVMPSQQSAPMPANIYLGYNPGNWRSDTPFHTNQAHGEIVFVKKWRTGEDPNTPRFLTLGQMNLVLRDAWNKYQTMLTANTGNDKKRQIAQAHAKEFAKHGEAYFRDDPMKIYGDSFVGLEDQKFLALLSKLSILENFRLYGVRSTHDANSDSMLKNIPFTTKLKGRENVVNYWSGAKMGDMLYLILKRELQMDNTPGCYQFVPWCGATSPTFTDLEYKDEAEIVCAGAVLKIGQAISKPKQDPSETARKNYTGLTRDCGMEQIFRNAMQALRIFVHMSI